MMKAAAEQKDVEEMRGEDGQGHFGLLYCSKISDCYVR